MPRTSYTIVVPESDNLPDVNGLFDYLEGPKGLDSCIYLFNKNKRVAHTWCKVISRRYSLPRPTLFSILCRCVEES